VDDAAYVRGGVSLDQGSPWNVLDELKKSHNTPYNDGYGHRFDELPVTVTDEVVTMIDHWTD
jgi:hypothetical protein